MHRRKPLGRLLVLVVASVSLTTLGCGKGKDKESDRYGTKTGQPPARPVRIMPAASPTGKAGTFELTGRRCVAKNLDLLGILGFLYRTSLGEIYEETPLPSAKFDMEIDLTGAQDPEARAKELLLQYIESEYRLIFEHGTYLREIWIVGDKGTCPGVSRVIRNDREVVFSKPRAEPWETGGMIIDLPCKLLGLRPVDPRGERLPVENRTGLKIYTLRGIKFRPLKLDDIREGETVTLEPTSLTLTRKQQAKEGWIVRKKAHPERPYASLRESPTEP